MAASVSDIYDLCGRLARLELDRAAFVRDCTRMIAEVIACSRAGIWLFEESREGRSLRCLGIYDRVNRRMTSARDETESHVQAYFEALEQIGHVLAPNARVHPATAGFFADQLGSNGVRSLLASSFSFNGQLLGAFTCTEVEGTAYWTTAQLTILKRIGARASLALAQAWPAVHSPMSIWSAALPGV